MMNIYLNLKRTVVALLAFTCLAWVSAQAQQSISGKITDALDGSGIPGVNIVEQGTTNGTITDFDGNYQLSVNSDATVIISYVGYQTQNIVVGSQSVIDVLLALDVTALAEIVVTGYGTQEKKEITSAITSVKEESFNRGAIHSPAQLLQGKVAGLTVISPGGNPNREPTIRLRGLATVGANAEPLIVIDGVIGADLNSVDPNDIASMDVLKDGSAAAIYGTRGSSGVIIVTTKTGTPGKTVIDYNGYVAIETIANQIEVLKTDEFVRLGGGDFGSETDWMDEITQTGVSQVHNLSLSGGTGNTAYRASFNVRDVEGIARTTGFTRLNARLTLSQSAWDDRISFSANIATTSKNSDFGFEEAFRYATVYNPSSPVRDDSDPTFDQYSGYFQSVLFDYFNPVAIIEQNINDGTDNGLNVNIRGEIEVVDGLRIAGFYSQQRNDEIRGEYYSKNSFFRGQNRNGLAKRSTKFAFNQLAEATATYIGTFDNLNLTVLGGYSWQDFLDESFEMEAGDFLTDEFTYNNMDAALDFSNGLATVASKKTSHKLIAFFGRVNLNYQGSYFLSASYRREGSSRFGADEKWGDFPAISAGVNLANVFDLPTRLLKLRASYGITGSIPNESYLSLQRFGPGENFFFEGNFVPSFGPVSNPNPGLKWERKAEIDVGVDFEMMEGRFTGTLDFYNRKTKDLILEFAVPVPPNLFDQTFINVGEIENTGFELALSYDVIQNDNMNWTTAMNFSTFNTKLNSLSEGDLEFGSGGEDFRAEVGAPGLNDISMVRVKEGDKLGEFWGPVFAGVDSNGDWIFEDIDGDGVVEPGFGEDDNTVIGNGLPNFELGWSNTLTWGNFDFNLFFRGSFGHDLINTFRIFYETVDPAALGTWNRVKTSFFREDLTAPNKFSSYQVEAAGFFKLDNLTLGYTLPLEGDVLSRVRFYFSGQNLFTITNYEGVDPEVRFGDPGASDNANRPGNEFSPDPLSPGIERRNIYFTARTFTFGINVTL